MARAASPWSSIPIASAAFSCVDEGLEAGTRVSGTGTVMRVPVGEGLLGRVVDPTGVALDGGPPVGAARHDPVERPPPASSTASWSPNR